MIEELLANETAKYLVNLCSSDAGRLYGLCWTSCCRNTLNSCIRWKSNFLRKQKLLWVPVYLWTAQKNLTEWLYVGTLP